MTTLTINKSPKEVLVKELPCGSRFKRASMSRGSSASILRRVVNLTPFLTTHSNQVAVLAEDNHNVFEMDGDIPVHTLENLAAFNTGVQYGQLELNDIVCPVGSKEIYLCVTVYGWDGDLSFVQITDKGQMTTLSDADTRELMSCSFHKIGRLTIEFA